MSVVSGSTVVIVRSICDKLEKDEGGDAHTIYFSRGAVGQVDLICVSGTAALYIATAFYLISMH
jgi:hypothetical protein